MHACVFHPAKHLGCCSLVRSTVQKSVEIKHNRRIAYFVLRTQCCNLLRTNVEQLVPCTLDSLLLHNVQVQYAYEHNRHNTEVKTAYARCSEHLIQMKCSTRTVMQYQNRTALYSGIEKYYTVTGTLPYLTFIHCTSQFTESFVVCEHIHLAAPRWTK